MSNESLLDRLRHRAMYSRTAERRAYWKRALIRNRANPPAVSGIGRNGLELITEFEGFYARPYRDPVGVWTIGYGTTKGVGPSTRQISRPEALTRLRSELDSEYAPAVFRAARRAGKTLTRNEADALISAVYNLGPGVLAHDRSLGAALRKRHGWRKATADALLLYDHAGGQRLPGLSRRRRAERDLFLKG